MPHPEKKRQRLQGRQCNNDEQTAGNNEFLVSIESLSGDVLANILGFLLPPDIMRARLNKRMREAAKITIVPPTYELVVNGVKRFNALRVMATALPNLQRIEICYLGNEHKYVDGDDPDEEEAARTADLTSHDIGIVSNFRKLRELTIERTYESFNGRYPCFFNFPHLQILSISTGHIDTRLKFDLEMLAGLPVLKELACGCNKSLTGNLNSLRVLKDTLQKVTMDHCPNVEGNIDSLTALKYTLEEVTIDDCPLIKGNFMDLADFPHLKVLDLRYTAVTGDIRDISEKDFLFLKELTLPKGVYGGMDQDFQHISDATGVIRTPYLFQKQRPEIVLKDWVVMLSDDSPDSYVSLDQFDNECVPVFIRFVRAGTRIGYRWENELEHPCEVNWLDPEPDRESTEYGKYMEELQDIEGQVDYFKGFHQPPPQEEFERIVERIHDDMFNDYAMGSELDSDSDSESDSGDDEMENN
jgi:hypothetical protein